MAKAGGWRKLLAERDLVEEAFVSPIWLLPLLGLVNCVPPGLWLYLIAVAVVILVEAGFAWLSGRPVPWKRLLVAAALGGLLGLGLAYLIWPFFAPRCPLAFWQLLLFAVGAAVLTLLLVLPLYRRAQRLK